MALFCLRSAILLNETLTQVFSCEFCKIWKNVYFFRIPLVAASKNRGFKSHLGQLSVAISNTSINPWVVNTIYISLSRCTNVITSRKFHLKNVWWLTKAIAEMKSDNEQTMKLEQLYKVSSECELNLWSDSSVG